MIGAYHTRGTVPGSCVIRGSRMRRLRQQEVPAPAGRQMAGPATGSDNVQS